MKNRIVTVILTIVIGVTGLGLTSCGEPNVNANYTGDTVVTDTSYRTSPRRCKVTLAYPNGEKTSKKVVVGELRKSGRAGCRAIKNGSKVVLKEGKIVSIEKAP